MPHSSPSAAFLPSDLYTKLHFCALLLVVITMPYAYAVNSTAVFILAGVWLWEGNWKHRFLTLRKTPLAWLFIGLFLLEVVGLIYTRDLSEGLFHLQKKVLLLAFPLLLGTIPSLSSRQVFHLLAAFVLTCVAGCLICLSGGIYYAITAGQFNRLFYHELASFIGMQGIYLSLYVGFSLLVVVYYLLEQWKTLTPRAKHLLVFLAFFFTGFILLLSIRTAIASILILLSGLYIKFFYRRHQLALGIITLIISITIFLLFIYLNPVSRQKFAEAFNPKESIQLNSDHSMSQVWGGKALRVAIWQCAWNVVKENLVFGVGTGDAQHALQESYRIHQFNFAYLYNTYNAHNQYLETWITLGAIGLSLLLASLLVPLILAFKGGNYLYILLIVFFALNCTTESVLERQKGVVFYAFFNSLLAFHANPVASLSYSLPDNAKKKNY